MSYADKLPEIAAQYKAEIREREKALHAKWLEFVKRLQEKKEKPDE